MLTKLDLFSAVEDGFVLAASDYNDWSGNKTIHDAGIEFLATARIAEKLIIAARSNDKESWINLEMPFQEIKLQSGVSRHKPGRKPLILQGNPRVDLAYFDRTQFVRGVIEIKRHLSYSNLSKDFNRICTLLDYYGKPYGRLKFGVVAAVRPISVTQTKTLDEVAGGIKERFEDDFGLKIQCRVIEKILSGEENLEFQSSEAGDDETLKGVVGLGIACFYIKGRVGD